MNKNRYLSFFVVLVSTVVISGCTVRTYKVTKDRVDQQIAGNRGYLSGEAPQTEEMPKATTRETYVVEVEFGSQTKYQDTTRTSVAKGKTEEEYGYAINEPIQVIQEDVLSEEAEFGEISESFTTYEVTKDDTLQKISKKFYGTYRKWKKIYDANKDKITDPNRIKPGLVIRIPQ